MQKISSLCKTKFLTKFSQITVFSIIELCLEMIHHVQQNSVSCGTSLEGSSDQHPDLEPHDTALMLKVDFIRISMHACHALVICISLS